MTMHIKKGENRQELMMLSYEMMISSDNPVRLIDLMCKKFISDKPCREEWKGTSSNRVEELSPRVVVIFIGLWLLE